MKNTPWFTITLGDSPLVAAAVHDGHEIREELAGLVALDEAGRLREEDPFTGRWTRLAPTRIMGHRSRFEMDLNRPREKAIYLRPEDAWGLNVWRRPLSAEQIECSLAQYDDFYAEVHRALSDLQRRFGRFVVFDFHSYNHRRDGAEGPLADPASNPEVNIGTGTMDRSAWAPVVERFLTDLRGFDFLGRNLDVRENVKFKGGQFSRWVHENFPNSGCALAIEFKKFFMDEWSGELDRASDEAIFLAMKSTVPGVLDELRKLGVS